MQSYPVADVETDFVPILLSVSIFKITSVFLPFPQMEKHRGYFEYTIG